jgi:hypothetical protein
MKKIDIGQALANPDVAKALSEFTVDMMSNSDVTKKLREAFVKNKELQSSSNKLIEAIESYNKKLLKKKVGFASSTTPHIYNLGSSSSNERLYKKKDNVFYVNLKNDEVVKAKIIDIDTAMSPPSYTIKRNDAIDNAEPNVEEYTLRVYDDNALDETKNVWLAEVNLRKVDNQMIIVKNKISKLNAELYSIRQNNVKYNEKEDYKKLLKEEDETNDELNHLFGERREAVSAVKLALAQEDKANGEVPLSKYKMNKRITILNKWDMDPLKEVWARAKEAYDDARKKVRDVDDDLAIENSKLAVSIIDSDNINIKTKIGLLNNQKTINEKAMNKAYEALIEATNAIPYYEEMKKEIEKDKPPPPYRRRTEGKNWTFTGGRNRRTEKAHYYSKRRRTRHYRSKRVRSK